jgi:hypothetical protein
VLTDVYRRVVFHFSSGPRAELAVPLTPAYRPSGLRIELGERGQNGRVERHVQVAAKSRGHVVNIADEAPNRTPARQPGAPGSVGEVGHAIVEVDVPRASPSAPCPGLHDDAAIASGLRQRNTNRASGKTERIVDDEVIARGLVEEETLSVSFAARS